MKDHTSVTRPMVEEKRKVYKVNGKPRGTQGLVCREQHTIGVAFYWILIKTNDDITLEFWGWMLVEKMFILVHSSEEKIFCANPPRYFNQLQIIVFGTTIKLFLFFQIPMTKWKSKTSWFGFLFKTLRKLNKQISQIVSFLGSVSKWDAYKNMIYGSSWNLTFFSIWVVSLVRGRGKSYSKRNHLVPRLMLLLRHMKWAVKLRFPLHYISFFKRDQKRTCTEAIWQGTWFTTTGNEVENAVGNK